MELLIGKVWLNCDWEGESCRDYMEVTSLEKEKGSLDEMLEPYDGKVVKITIEVLDE